MKFDTTPRGPLVAGQLGGASNAYVDADGVQVTDGTTVRVRLGKLPSGDYGLQIVNGADTTIIDGTSNVFKIVASGTMTHTQGALSTGSTTLEITGSGLPAQSPSFDAFLTEGTSPSDTANRDVGRFTKPRAASNQLWAASSSGGSPTSDFFPLTWQAYAHSGVSGGNPAIRLVIDNGQGSSVSAYMRFYIYLESGI